MSNQHALKMASRNQLFNSISPNSAVPHWFVERSAILGRRYGHHDLCPYCDKDIRPRDLNFEHVVPKSAGGEHGWINRVPCHKDCNGYRASTPLLMWLRILSETGMNPAKACHRVGHYWRHMYTRSA